MKIDFAKVKGKETIAYSGDLNYFNNFNKSKTIKEFKSVEGKVTLEKADAVLIIKYDIKAVLDVFSTLTNEPFEYPISIDETLYYTSEKEMESEDVFYIKEGRIELEEDIYSLIVTSLPLILHKEGEEFPHGKNYRVLKEDELNEDDGSSYSPFDKLKDLDL